MAAEFLEVYSMLASELTIADWSQGPKCYDFKNIFAEQRIGNSDSNYGYLGRKNDRKFF
jgi:hypothetical protein